jgi:branched-chain amino acid transport system permease protein
VITAWQILLEGLIPAALYAPIACGLVIVYRSSRVLNFAQGVFCFVGAYVFYWFAEDLHLAVALSLVFTFVGVFLIGVFLYYLLLRPLLSRGPIVVVMVTIALTSVLEAVIFLIFGTNTDYINDLVPQHRAFSLPGGVVFSDVQVGTIIASVISVVALILFLKFSNLGRTINAVSDSPTLAAYWGYNSVRLVSITWGISFFLSTLAGVAYALSSSLDSGILALGTIVFPVVLIGGMDSLGGALIGSLIFGVMTQGVTVYWGGQWPDFVGYASLLVILTIRPFGLFGTKELVRL